MASGYFVDDGAGGLVTLADISGVYDMFFESDGAGGIRTRATALEPTFPIVGKVRTTAGAFGWSGEYTPTEIMPTAAQVEEDVGFGANGTEFLGEFEGGGGSPPTAPDLAAVNNEDGTVTATVSGADAGTTNRVYSMPVGGSAWTLKASIAANGAATFSLAAGGYWLKVESDNGSQSIGDILYLSVTDGTQSLVHDLVDAIVTELNAIGWTESFTATRGYVTFKKLEDLADLTVIVTPRTKVQDMATRRLDRNEHEIMITITTHVDTDSDADDLVHLVEDIARYLLRLRLSGFNCTETKNDPMFDADLLRERRQFHSVISTTWMEIF